MNAGSLHRGLLLFSFPLEKGQLSAIVLFLLVLDDLGADVLVDLVDVDHLVVNGEEEDKRL